MNHLNLFKPSYRSDPSHRMGLLIEVNVFRRAANKTAQVSNKMTGIKTRRHISITHRQHQAAMLTLWVMGWLQIAVCINWCCSIDRGEERVVSWSSAGHGCISDVSDNVMTLCRSRCRLVCDTSQCWLSSQQVSASSGLWSRPRPLSPLTVTGCHHDMPGYTTQATHHILARPGACPQITYPHCGADFVSCFMSAR